jgi:pullulanase/glycogen debranching enzyme
LDVVFNHSAEGNHEGPTLSFKGIDNATYYLLEENPLTTPAPVAAAIPSRPTTPWSVA